MRHFHSSSAQAVLSRAHLSRQGKTRKHGGCNHSQRSRNQGQMLWTPYIPPTMSFRTMCYVFLPIWKTLAMQHSKTSTFRSKKSSGDGWSASRLSKGSTFLPHVLSRRPGRSYYTGRPGEKQLAQDLQNKLPQLFMTWPYNKTTQTLHEWVCPSLLWHPAQWLTSLAIRPTDLNGSQVVEKLLEVKCRKSRPPRVVCSLV